MPACIVCKGYYEAGQPCKRCGSDSSAWEEWKREEEALGPVRALLCFLEPYFGLPLLIAGWALTFGLLGMIWPWSGVKPYVVILVVVFTFVGCVLTVPFVYGMRFAIREQELLSRVRRGRGKGIGIETQILLVPAIVFGLSMLLTFSMTQSRTFWELMEWLVLEEAPVPGEGAPPPLEELSLREELERVFPLMCLNSYVTLVAFAYSASLMLGQAYAWRLNERLPQPIFLREDLLAQVVRREAERIVCRSSAPRVTGDEETSNENKETSKEVEQERRWIWDEMERTDDGGIRFRAIVQVEAEENLIGYPNHITYEVEANPWGRIIKVVRKGEK